MQTEEANKGLTVLIFDDNKREMQNLSDALHDGDPWFDPFYQQRKKKGKNDWNEVLEGERFSHIVNTAFAIKSQHSSLVQVADAVSYAHRRHLELKGEKEEWEGEKKYFDDLANKLGPIRQRLSRNPGGLSIDFYNAVRHDEWVL